MSFSTSSLFQYILTVLLLLSSCTALPMHLGERKLERRFGAGTKVTNNCANWNNKNMLDGPSTLNTAYQFYSGTSANFPDRSKWISFDAMFEANRPLMKQSCGWNGWGPDNADRHINWIKTYIQQVSRESHVDHRAILAVIMQESAGCLRVPTTNNGVSNPGIMQSHNGVAFDPLKPVTTIRQMIIDGTQGTAYGDGLAQLLNQYGDYYSAFRAYNSGSIAPSGDLSNGNGATNCYVSDIANRLMGWTLGSTTCH